MANEKTKKNEKAVLKLGTSERKLLTEIGMTAAGNGYKDEALEIFDVLELAGGNQVSLAVGRCFAYAGGREMTKALGVLTEAWDEKQVTEVDMAMTLLAMRSNNLEGAATFANRCLTSENQLLVGFGESIAEQIAATNPNPSSGY